MTQSLLCLMKQSLECFVLDGLSTQWLEYFWPVPKFSEYTHPSPLTVHDPETTSKVRTGGGGTTCGTSAGGVCGACMEAAADNNVRRLV